MTPAGVVRAIVAAVLIVIDATVAWLWLGVLSNTPRLQSVIVASVATLAVGACCLVAVIVLSLRSRATTTRPTRSSAPTVLGAVAVLTMIAGFVAMSLAGAFTDLFASQVLLGTMIPTVATVVLSVLVAREASRATAGANG